MTRMRPNDEQLQMSRQKMNGGSFRNRSVVHKWTIKDPI